MGSRSLVGESPPNLRLNFRSHHPHRPPLLLRNPAPTRPPTPDFSRVKHARGYFPVVAERITTNWHWESYEHWHEQSGSKRTWSWIRKRETPSRFSTSISCQVQIDIVRSCEGRSSTFCSVARWDIWPGIAQIVERVTILESTSGERLVALWG